MFRHNEYELNNEYRQRIAVTANQQRQIQQHKQRHAEPAILRRTLIRVLIQTIKA